MARHRREDREAARVIPEQAPSLEEMAAGVTVTDGVSAFFPDEAEAAPEAAPETSSLPPPGRKPEVQQAPVAAVAEPTTPPAQPAPTPAVARKKLWLVELGCPTPLRERRMRIEADTPSEAQEIYCRHNGIGGSSHSWTITEVREE